MRPVGQTATYSLAGMAPLLMVHDVAASIRFYRDVLGFVVADSAGPPEDLGWALLRREGIEVMLNSLHEAHDRPSSPDPDRGAAHGDTILYFNCRELEALYAHLRASGVAVDPPSPTSYGYREIRIDDPDGFGLCFFWPDRDES